MATYIPGPSSQVNADWNATSGVARILNKPALGSAASLSVGTAAGDVVQLDNTGKLPAVDGSALINLNISGLTVGTADLVNGAVTYAKIQDVSATDRLLGRSSAGAGAIEEIVCTTAGRTLIAGVDSAAQRTALGLGTLATQSGTFSGTSSGVNTGDQTIVLTGDVTGSGAGSFAATLATTGVAAGAYGSTSQVPSITVDAKGRITAASNTSITVASEAISDSTAAGRALLTSSDAATQRASLGLGTLATQSGTFSGSSSGTNTGDQTISLTGDVTGSGTGSFAATLVTTGVTASSYGTASQVPTITVDAKGRLTAASNTAISIAATGISDSTAAGRTLLTSADAGAQRTALGVAAAGGIVSSGLTMTTARLLGRTTASSGAIEEIAIGSGLSLSGGILSNTGSAANAFSVIAVSGQSSVEADTSSDTLTLAAGAGISIATNSTTDTVTVSTSYALALAFS